MNIHDFLKSDEKTAVIAQGSTIFYVKKPVISDGFRVPDVDLIITNFRGELVMFTSWLADLSLSIMFRHVRNDELRQQLHRIGYKFYGPACDRILVKRQEQSNG